MAQRYTNTDYLYPLMRRHVTYVTTRPAMGSAPGMSGPGTIPQPPVTPVNLDPLIAKRREKARRMRQR